MFIFLFSWILRAGALFLVIIVVVMMCPLFRTVLIHLAFTLCIGITESYTLENSLRVLNGRNATENELPFVVSLETIKPHVDQIYRFCTGSLISKTWVLTAAHCIVFPSSDIHIRYGNVTSPKNTSHTFSKVLRQVIHPNYKQLLNIGLSYNDIALMLVESVPNEVFLALSAADYKSMMGHKVQLAGFGRMNISDSVFINEFQTMPLQIADGFVKKCDTGAAETIGPSICVSHACDKYQQVYKGDSGGPLLYRGKQAGVAGSVAHIQGYVLISRYTPVSPFLHWIRYVIKNYVS